MGDACVAATMWVMGRGGVRWVIRWLGRVAGGRLGTTKFIDPQNLLNATPPEGRFVH